MVECPKCGRSGRFRVMDFRKGIGPTLVKCLNGNPICGHEFVPKPYLSVAAYNNALYVLREQE